MAMKSVFSLVLKAEDYPIILSELAKAGFDGMEPVFHPAGLPSPENWKVQAKQLAGAASKTGLVVPGRWDSRCSYLEMWRNSQDMAMRVAEAAVELKLTVGSGRSLILCWLIRKTEQPAMVAGGMSYAAYREE